MTWRRGFPSKMQGMDALWSKLVQVANSRKGEYARMLICIIVAGQMFPDGHSEKEAQLMVCLVLRDSFGSAADEQVRSRYGEKIPQGRTALRIKDHHPRGSALNLSLAARAFECSCTFVCLDLRVFSFRDEMGAHLISTSPFCASAFLTESNLLSLRITWRTLKSL